MPANGSFAPEAAVAETNVSLRRSNLYTERNSGGEPSPVGQRKADGLRRGRFGRKRSRTDVANS